MADHVGKQFGNYQLVRLLGEGGFAEVYLGEHVFLGTQAAIKVLHTQLAAEDSEHFRSEARLIARLDHPNIVRVLEFGVEGKVPFLVMSYAPYGTLRQLHPKGTPLPLATIVSYVKQIADALQYAHDQRLIHRDVKPENMLVGRHNEVLLSDFGIAFVAQSSHYQATQDVVGTVAYMAPEQIQGKPVPASDQYALAVVVYEWISGTRPFQGTYVEIAIQHSVAPPPPLHEKIPALPSDIERVVMMALAKDPQQRFATIQAFANALEQASQPGQRRAFPPVAQRLEPTVPATPFPPAQPLAPSGAAYPSSVGPQPARRSVSRRTVLLGLAGLAVAGGGLAWWRLFQKSSSPQSNAIPPTASSHATATSAATAVPVGTTLFIYRGHHASVGAIAWSPSHGSSSSPGRGSRIASGSGDGTVQVWDATTGGHLLVYSGHSPKGIESVVWSPDGQRIASSGDDNTVQVWDAATGNPVLTYKRHTDIVWAVAWSPDGKYIASASSDQTVQVWDAASGNLVNTYQGHKAMVYALAWSSDSTRIASASDDHTVQIWDAISGSNVLTYTRQSGLVTSVAWSPDSSRIASGAHDRTVQIWNPISGNTLITCLGHAGQVDSVAWAPDSTRLVSASTDSTARLWDSTSGNSLYTYTGHSDIVWAVAWSPDGKRVASSSNDSTVHIWQAE